MFRNNRTDSPAGLRNIQVYPTVVHFRHHRSSSFPVTALHITTFPTVSPPNNPMLNFLYRSDPVRITIFINFKTQFTVNVCRMCKTQMAVNITVKMITCCIFHTLFQFYKLRRLICHIDPGYTPEFLPPDS